MGTLQGTVQLEEGAEQEAPAVRPALLKEALACLVSDTWEQDVMWHRAAPLWDLGSHRTSKAMSHSCPLATSTADWDPSMPGRCLRDQRQAGRPSAGVWTRAEAMMAEGWAWEVSGPRRPLCSPAPTLQINTEHHVHS